MNLSTRRLTEEEFLDWSLEAHRRTLALSVSDRLGNAGLTGLVSVEVEGDVAKLVDFVLSCRVMGRMVEAAMLSIATGVARDLGARRLTAELRPTAKNGPCRAFFAESGLTAVGGDTYEWDLGQTFEFPSVLSCVTTDDAKADAT